MNSYIFSSNKFPGAAFVALLMIAALELTSWFVLRIVDRSCSGGELIRMDPDYFCRDYQRYAPCSDEILERYSPEIYDSWEEIGQDGPYEVLVFGSSVCTTNWAGMFKELSGLKVANITGNAKFRSNFVSPSGFIDLIANYRKINPKSKMLLLWVDFTDRMPFRFETVTDVRREITYNARWHERTTRIRTPIVKLLEYSLKKIKIIKEPQVKIMDLGGRNDFFYIPDIEALSNGFEYTKDEIDRVIGQFAEFKKIAQENNAMLAVIAFPTKPQLYDWLIEGVREMGKLDKRTNLNILKKAAQRNDIPFLSLEDELKSYSKDLYKRKAFLWQVCDSHVNVTGDKIIAREVVGFIRNLEIFLFDDVKSK